MDVSEDYPRSAASVLLPSLAFISLILMTPPLVWHYRNRNVAACSLIFWIALANIFLFINALIWPTDDVKNWWGGQGLCDVEVKLTWSFAVGASGSLCCIMRNLAKVMDVDRVRFESSRSQRRRSLVVDLLWCYACPIYTIAIDYVVQQNRYYIFTVSGCTPSIDSSWPSIFLIFIWAPVFCVIESYYCVLVIIRLYKYRQQFSSVLNSSNSNLNRSRFVRLFLLSLTLLVLFIPIQGYILYINLSFPRHPYDWKLLHGPYWSDIIKVPTGGQVTFDCWIRVVCGFLIFLFFGLGKDALVMYREWLVAIGLGKVFPSLIDPRRNDSVSTGSSYSTKLQILSSRARSMFRKGSQATTTTATTSSFTHPSISNSSDVAGSSLCDPLKSMSESYGHTWNYSISPPPASAQHHGRQASCILPPPIDPKPWLPFTIESVAVQQTSSAAACANPIPVVPAASGTRSRYPSIDADPLQMHQVHANAWSAGRHAQNEQAHIGGQVNVRTEVEIERVHHAAASDSQV